VRAFIVRPFGPRSGIDFDRVEQELIGPVLDSLGIEGRTTQEIARAGNIRTDMFARLLLADLVIADISVHNANVYYELGIRHGLRPRTTILIRAKGDDVPFDLQTDRYLEYDADEPAGAREKLTDAINQSRVADNADSPVFLLLPALKAADPDDFRPVPEDFTASVRDARAAGDLPLLAVLGEEAADFEWALPGLRLVGHAQFAVRGLQDARVTWEAVRARRPDDPDANLLLGTIYQRLGDFVASTAAVERVIDRPGLPFDQLAEAMALKGRNAKERWIADWEALPEDERAAAALRSPFLEEARRVYDQAFMADQNHWYPGINALALTVITLELAERAPGAWSGRFEDEDEADRQRRVLDRQRAELDAALRRSLAADAFRAELRGDEYDVWADLTRADLRLLTTPDKPDFVAAKYAEARARTAQEQAGDFPAESAARQIRMYRKLGLFGEAVQASLDALGAAPEEPAGPVRRRIVVFSGHRIDAPSRPEPRFPPGSEETAAAMIRAAVADEKARAEDRPLAGLAGGASGGDILFHEACAELGIPTRLLLALPRDQFAVESVQDAGPDWMERYRTLCETVDVKVLATSTELPRWLAARDGYTIWERNNRWLLHTALSRSDTDITLIVLWDGKGGDGPGGTADMVGLAESRGVRIVRLDATKLR
jgi:tetratricopeptide (TPR) repeat protein